MKALTHFLLVILLISDYSRGDTVDAASIRQLMERMDDSLVRGNIYHIDYNVCEKRTDAFYAHKNQLIKLLEQAAAAQGGTASVIPEANGATSGIPTTYEQLIRQFKKELKLAREQTTFSDYSLDGTGFYLKTYVTFVDANGKAASWPASITVSDGKIMGNFYLDQSQAVIQPATERPRVGSPMWTNIAYLFLQSALSTYMGNYQNLSMKVEGGNFVITGEKVLGPKERAQTEFRIDKATLMPQSLTQLYYNDEGYLHQKLTKTWQYQNVSGLMVPETVIDREYKSVLNESPELEREQILTVTQWNPIPLDAKAEFAKLLKLNLSVFDQITGTHYMTGNPGTTLDKLSK